MDPVVDPTDADRHEQMHAAFTWHVPPRFNIAEACCRRWVRQGLGESPAILWEAEDGSAGTLTYGQLQSRADRLSQRLLQIGIGRGDRVAIVMPQRPETAVAHIAIYQLGAIAMPLSMLFGPEAMAQRLLDSGAVAAIVDPAALPGLSAARKDCPALRTVLDGVTGTLAGRETGSDHGTDASAEGRPFEPMDTAADDPAVLIYTSGTTGPPKGALIPHRALIGNLPGFVCSQNGFGARGPARLVWAPVAEPVGVSGAGSATRQGADAGEGAVAGFTSDANGACAAGAEVFWSPADWAWTGGLMDALLPTLYFGRPIVAWHGRFSPERAFELMQRHAVTHTFLFPTALKAMMKAVPQPRQRFDLRLRAVMSAGEAVGDAVFHWCKQALGVTVNEMFGQTEINYIVGNCGSVIDAEGRTRAGWPARPGSMGRPYPGHRVAVIDEDGLPCGAGVPGDVALHRRDVHGELDPVFFLGYWNNGSATAAKFTGDPDSSWCRTGDTAVMDADGYLWYQGRSDDIFKVAGYRIGPGEIENCLVKHPAVALAAVVPKPDAERGAVVKAYVVLAPGHAGDEALVRDLQEHVRGRLAPYEYPKEIEFIDALPMTATGKVQRRVLRLREEALNLAGKPASAVKP